MAFAKATSRSVIGVVLRLPRPCGLGLVALRTVLLAGPRPCQGRGRGFESLRPLQDLTDFTMVGRCAQGNIWGNSVPNHERLLAKGRASFQHPAGLTIPISPPICVRASTLIAIANFTVAVVMLGAMATGGGVAQRS